jgi:hypothetical protein
MGLIIVQYHQEIKNSRLLDSCAGSAQYKIEQHGCLVEVTQQIFAFGTLDMERIA